MKLESKYIPKLPAARYAAAGYYSSAYFVIQPKNSFAPDDEFDLEKTEEFDPELEPDYFLEYGYPEPTPPEDKEKIEQKTIILCHGLATNGLQFVDDAYFFAEQGFKVIVPDLRGHGRSKTPPKRNLKKDDFTIKQMANDLISILNREGVKQVHWVGHSIGAVLALEIMNIRKDLIKDLVVFGASFSLEKSPTLVRFIQLGSKLLSRKNQNQFLTGLVSKNPKTKALAYHMFKEANQDCMFLIARNFSNFNLIDNALNFDGAILMLQTEWDVFIHKEQKETLQKMKEKPIFFHKNIKAAGHLANLDQPNILREEVLDFVGGGWIFAD